MKILVLMDSFKGSLSSPEAGQAVKEGILAADEMAEVLVCPFADGGEGTLEAFLADDKGSHSVNLTVTGPLGKETEACYGVLSDGTAVIEMAKAAGLCLVKEDQRDPMRATTRGVGQLIRRAIEDGCRNFIIALGGSATNDCGAGMLQELGFGILDAEGKPVRDGAMGLADAALVSDSSFPGLKECSFTIACDVRNPLFGKDGASYVFAPQKGASPEDVEKMDSIHRSFAEVVKRTYPEADSDAEGAGAAGGLGYAFRTFLGGSMQPGAEVLLSRTGIEKEMAAADLVITGEGRMDRQTAMGKAPVRIAGAAKKYGKPVIAVVGCVGDGAEKCHEAGVDAVFPSLSSPMTAEMAMDRETAARNVRRTACEIIRLFEIKKF